MQYDLGLAASCPDRIEDVQTDSVNVKDDM